MRKQRAGESIILSVPYDFLMIFKRSHLTIRSISVWEDDVASCGRRMCLMVPVLTGEHLIHIQEITPSAIDYFLAYISCYMSWSLHFINKYL